MDLDSYKKYCEELDNLLSIKTSLNKHNNLDYLPNTPNRNLKEKIDYIFTPYYGINL